MRDMRDFALCMSDLSSGSIERMSSTFSATVRRVMPPKSTTSVSRGENSLSLQRLHIWCYMLTINWIYIEQREVNGVLDPVKRLLILEWIDTSVRKELLIVVMRMTGCG